MLLKKIVLCLCVLTFANCCFIELGENRDETQSLELMRTEKLPEAIEFFDIMANDETLDTEMELSGESSYVAAVIDDGNASIDYNGSGDDITVTTDDESSTLESETETTISFVDDNLTISKFPLMFSDVETEYFSETQDFSFEMEETDESESYSTTESSQNFEEDYFDENRHQTQSANS